MSSQRGNVSRSRQQKHKNSKAFKNDMHDKTQKMASINKTELPGICPRCKEKIEWKIKYGKYKPLTVPRKCNKCQEKCVKKAYYTVCYPCGSAAGVCCKCGEKKDVVERPGLTEAEQAAEHSKLEQELKFLTERQRRSFFRLQEKGELSGKFGEEKLSNQSFDSDNDDDDDDDDDSHDSKEDRDCRTLQLKSTKCDGQDESSHSELCEETQSDLNLET